MAHRIIRRWDPVVAAFTLIPADDPACARAVLIARLARALGWCDRAAAHLLGDLATRDLVAALHIDPEETRRLLFVRVCERFPDYARAQAA